MSLQIPTQMGLQLLLQQEGRMLQVHSSQEHSSHPGVGLTHGLTVTAILAAAPAGLSLFVITDAVAAAA